MAEVHVASVERSRAGWLTQCVTITDDHIVDLESTLGAPFEFKSAPLMPNSVELGQFHSRGFGRPHELELNLESGAKVAIAAIGATTLVTILMTAARL